MLKRSRRAASWGLGLATVCVLAAAGRAEDDPHRPAAIATQDVPVVPDSIFERLNQYQNIREAVFHGWAPDGNGILIGTRFGNSAQLHRVYTPGGRREQITFFVDPASGRFLPKQTDGATLVTSSKGGSENDQIYLLDPAKFSLTLLTDGKSKNELGPVRDNGQQMIVHSNRRNGRDTDLYLADCRTPDSMAPLMQTDGEYWVATDWSLDGSKLLMLRYVSANESYPAMFDIATKQRTPLPLPTKQKAAVSGLVFVPDGQAAYLATDARGEFNTLAKVDLEKLTYKWLSEDIRWDIDDTEVDHTTGLLALTVNENGQSKLFFYDGKQRRPAELPPGIVANMKFSPDGKQLGFTLARTDAPAEAYSISVTNGQLTRWTYSEAGGLNPANFVRPERIEYSSFDSRKIPAYYYRPAGASKEHPAAVMIDVHGGPESQFRPYFSGRTQFYVHELGVAVISPNVRGSAGYGKSYLLLDNAEKREDSVKDIGALLDWIAKQPELDASRVAVAGGSYGGYMVLASLTNFPDRIKAGVDVVGIANFISFLEHTAAYRQDLRRAEYGDERDPAMRAVFERINPIANADKIRSALLVAHGRNDPRVPFNEAQQIADKVRGQGRPVWTVYADNEGHGFAKKDNRDYFRGVEVLFLQENLLK